MVCFVIGSQVPVLNMPKAALQPPLQVVFLGVYASLCIFKITKQLGKVSVPLIKSNHIL